MNRLSIIAVVIKLAWFAVAAHGETVQITIHGYERCETGQCQQVIGYASGVTIGQLPDGSDAILTAGHSYRGLSQPQTTVGWFGGAHIPARVVAVGSDVDAAVLAVRLPTRPKCKPLSESIQAGDPVKSLGFAEGTQSQARDGTWNGSIVPGVYPRQGESGGPVFIAGGIGGLIVGYDRDGMVVETCQRIRGWMVSVGCYPVCPAVVQPPPVRQIQVAPGVPRPAPSLPPVAVAGCDCSTQLSDLKAMLAAERQQNKSQAGLIVELEGRVKAIEEIKFPVRTLAEDSQSKWRIFSEEIVTLGDPIEFRLVKKKYRFLKDAVVSGVKVPAGTVWSFDKFSKSEIEDLLANGSIVIHSESL